MLFGKHIAAEDIGNMYKPMGLCDSLTENEYIKTDLFEGNNNHFFFH